MRAADAMLAPGRCDARTSAFDLPNHLVAKADPALIAANERRFAAIAESLQQSIADLSDQLATERRAPGGEEQAALTWDLETHRRAGRLRTARAQRWVLRRWPVTHVGHGLGSAAGEAVPPGRSSRAA